MSRIGDIFGNPKRRKLLIPFFTSGYPTRAKSVELVRVALDSGADMVELGMPFSDPMADGSEIQLSSQTALDRGHTMADLFGTVTKIRSASAVPLILMGYFNPVLAHGLDKFTSRLAECGGDGLIIPDLPVDEAAQLAVPAERNGLSMVYLIAPTSSRSRVAAIDRAATDFAYAVTVTGVTGGRSGYRKETMQYLRGLKHQLTKPFVAGFGVSSPESARQLAHYADGVVIGSALIKTYRTSPNHQTGLIAVGHLLKSIRRGLDR
jgi:tryptophan synthase alpha chain